MPTHDHDRRQAATRHTNAAAAFALLASVFFIGGAATIGAALEKKATMPTQVVAATPLVAGSLSAGVAYVSRKRAAALRRAEAAAPDHATNSAGDAPPPAA